MCYQESALAFSLPLSLDHSSFPLPKFKPSLSLLLYLCYAPTYSLLPHKNWFFVGEGLVCVCARTWSCLSCTFTDSCNFSRDFRAWLVSLRRQQWGFGPTGANRNKLNGVFIAISYVECNLLFCHWGCQHVHLGWLAVFLSGFSTSLQYQIWFLKRRRKTFRAMLNCFTRWNNSWEDTVRGFKAKQNYKQPILYLR